MPASRRCPMHAVLLAFLIQDVQAAASGHAGKEPRQMLRHIRGFAEPRGAEEAAVFASGLRAGARRLQVRDGWMVHSVQSSLQDGAPGKYAYFDEAATPGYEFKGDETKANVKQYRNGVLIWQGQATLKRSTEGLVGTCGMDFCNAMIRRQTNVAAGQWQIGDVIVVEGFHDVVDPDIVVALDKEEEAKAGTPPIALILVIVAACIIGLSCLALGCWYCRRRKASQRLNEDKRMAPAVVEVPPAEALLPAVVPSPKVLEEEEANRQVVVQEEASAEQEEEEGVAEEAAAEEDVVQDTIQAEMTQESAQDFAPRLSKYSWQDYYANNI
mmetsp:Transcript_87285/g.242105  ORF Transcript_87285/g.242105 Transcript_87285/m.242105 type:complete len:327 (+) Transcript_87285:74-1054(+)